MIFETITGQEKVPLIVKGEGILCRIKVEGKPDEWICKLQLVGYFAEGWLDLKRWNFVGLGTVCKRVLLVFKNGCDEEPRGVARIHNLNLEAVA